ncbi:MAG: type II toxin-antitoxin system PemK/MazF family toxin [Thermoanaerobaculia bacterium]
MPPTTSFDFGDIVLVEFFFTDRSGSKRRPAVVASSSRYNQRRPDVILMAITSKLRSPLLFGETLITSWQKAGLLVPGAIKPILLTIDKTLVIKHLGRIEPADRTSLETTLRTILSSP